MKIRQELSGREIEHLHETLTRRLGDTSVPTLPQVAVRIIELVADPNSTFAQFAEVVRTDQALTGRILRMANSAAFAQQKPVTSIQRAAVLMGMDRLQAMSLGFHLSKAASSDDTEYSFKRIWTQSLFRAALAYRIAECYNSKICGEAFIIGLMLDVGIPMMPKLAGGRYSQLVHGQDPPGKQFLAEYCNLELTHVDVVTVLCQMWRLPEVLVKPISLHHSAANGIDPKDDNSILHAIAYFVGSIPLDPEGMMQANPPIGALARRLFSKDTDDMDVLLERAAADFSATRDMFSHIIDESLSVDQILEQANGQLSDAVEDLVEENLTSESRRQTARFEIAEMIIEIEPASSNKVTVYLADQNGTRLLSEQIDPASQSEDDIKSILLLDDASEGDVRNVLDGITRLAA